MVFESDYKELRKHLHKIVHVQAYPSIDFKTGILYKVAKKFIKVLVIVKDDHALMEDIYKCELFTITKYHITKLNYPDEYEHEIIIDEFADVSNLKNFYNIKPAFEGYSQRKKKRNLKFYLIIPNTPGSLMGYFDYPRSPGVCPHTEAAEVSGSDLLTYFFLHFTRLYIQGGRCLGTCAIQVTLSIYFDSRSFLAYQLISAKCN